MSIRRISLGTAQLGAAYGIANRGGTPSAETANEILTVALDAGIRHIDTAPIYGEAEERIGRFVRECGLGDTFEICTKLSRLDDDSSSPKIEDSVYRSIGASLEKLAVPVLSEVLIHDVELLNRYGRELIDALLLARERGWLKKIGVSVYRPEDLPLLDEFPELEIVQHPLSVFDQRLLDSGCLEKLKSNGCIVQARSVFLQGLATLSAEELPREVAHARDPLSKYRELLSDSELTIEEAAVLFVMSTDVDRVVIGTETAAQLRMNIDAISKSMPEELFQRLRTAFPDISEQVIDPRRWSK
ncbi:MAG: aldo/keto reductase [Gammaproteobacteria bacterium]